MYVTEKKIFEGQNFEDRYSLQVEPGQMNERCKLTSAVKFVYRTDVQTGRMACSICALLLRYVVVYNTYNCMISFIVSFSTI